MTILARQQAVCADSHLPIWWPLIILTWSLFTTTALDPTVATAEVVFQESPSVSIGPRKLSLEDALGLFLKSNFDVLAAKYGIETSRAQQITAGLLPNPVLSVGLFSSFTQGCTAGRCGAVMPQVSQLFLVAGKRGFRIESAELGSAASEALFEDTVRQLSFAVSDTYYRVQAEREHLAIDRKNRDQIADIVAGTAAGIRPIPIERRKIRLELLLVKAERELIKDLREIENALADLRILLGQPPGTKLDLTTPLIFRPYDPDMVDLRGRIADRRPDIRARKLLQAKRERELKLATAMAYPDVTIGAGVMLQGPQGPDNQQQWMLGLGVPLPLFNRNQGGIQQAAVAVDAGDAEYRRTLNQALNELEVTYYRLTQAKRMVDTYQTGTLDRALTLLDLARKAYETNELNILELVDASRTANETKEDYVDALYGYQRAVLNLESAAGQSLNK